MSTFKENVQTLEDWAKNHSIQFVNRSYGQYTTQTICRDDLIELIAKAKEEAVKECAAKVLAWGDTHEPAQTVSARNMASKLARGIESGQKRLGDEVKEGHQWNSMDLVAAMLRDGAGS